MLWGEPKIWKNASDFWLWSTWKALSTPWPPWISLTLAMEKGMSITDRRRMKTPWIMSLMKAASKPPAIE